MALLSSLHSQFLGPRITRFTKPHHQNVDFCQTNRQDKHICFCSKEDLTKSSLKVQRRDVLLHSVFGLVCLPAMAPLANAEEVAQEGFRIYYDEVNKFKIMIPQDWQIGQGEGNGFKSVTAFYPSDTSNSNVSVSIVITGLGADFTRLESFGKVDAFAENLVSGLDRSWQRPPGVSAKLVDSRATKGMYYIEYSLRNPGESERHLLSVLGIANNGWYNRLYTLTGQYLDEEAQKYRSKIEKAVSSFKLV